MKSLRRQKVVSHTEKTQHATLQPKHTFSSFFLFIFLLIAATLVTSCSRDKGTFTIKGKLSNLNQADFLIYSIDGAIQSIDTLHLKDGRFTYSAPLSEPATLQILYPNFSELTLFLQGGSNLYVRGNARNLNHVEVKGDENNELYTRFRSEADQKGREEVLQLARQYVLEHPETAVGRYLFRRYFLQDTLASREETHEVFDSILRILPNDIYLARMADAVRSKGMLRVGAEFPDFSLQVRSTDKDSVRTITATDFPGKCILFAFWASWKSGSQSVLFRSRKVLRQEEGRIQPISYSLDVDDLELQRIEKRDTVTFPSYCDFQSWRGSLVRQIGLQDIPYYILLDSTRHIIAAGSDWAADIEPTIQDTTSKL